MGRPVLLLTIGAGALPVVTPIVPVTTTPTVDGYTATALAPPTAMTTAVTVDGVQIGWTASTVAGCSYIIESALDVSGSPGTFTEVARTTNTQYTYPLQAKRWVRVRATLNGRNSSPTSAVAITPIASTQIAANASAITTLGTRMTAAEGVNTSQAGQITTLQTDIVGKASVSAVSALDARVTTTEAGITTFAASYTLVLDVNGKISGFRSVNDGTTSTFEVAADAFKVVKPAGGDALTWTGGVLTALKGSYSVKLGAGFGSSSDLVLWFGADGDTSTRTVANAKVAITKDGLYKLGSTQLNYGSGWASGAAITYSATAGTPATATISVTAGTFRFGAQSLSYAASSASVSGTNGTNVTYWLYYDDPGLSGGSKTLTATTDTTDTFNSDTRVLVGKVAVAYPASGGGSGGGGGNPCVSVRAWVIGRSGPVRAGTVRVGDELLLCDPQTGEECWGVVTYSQTKPAPGVRLQAGAAWLTCSTTAPIPTDIGYVLAPDTQGRNIAVRNAGGVHFARSVAAVTDAGMIEVQHITVGDRCFWAGDTEQFFVLHHNIKLPE